MSSQLQVSGEAKIRDIQGPVVANSGVITALDGAASQYVRGDGTLADFPTSSGGGSSVSYYLNSSVSQGTIGGVAYRELSKEPIIGAGTDIAISANGYVASYITDVNDPDVVIVPGGNFNCEFYFSVNNNTGNPTTYAELYKYDGTTFTLLGTSAGVPESINQGTIIAPYYFAIPVATAALALTDRLAIRIYVNVDGRTVTLHTENGHLCQVVTTLSKGMVSLNNLTDQSQFITTGTTGTDFNIVSSGDTHTFNLPIASATNTGKLSSTDWSTFNNKQAALTFTAPLVNTSNTISIPAATSLVDGYLDNADWVNFNTAYNNMIVSAAVTGTTTKTLTLTQQDAGTITASWTDDNTDAVTSVFGRTGAVVAQSGDYTTTQVTEGTNLYFTNARAQSAITGGASTITTSNLDTSKALSSNSSGKVVTSITTATELSYLSGVSSNVQTQLDGKAATFTLGSVSSSPTSVLVITGSGAPVNGSLTFTINQSSSSQNGYLSSTDWSTFNNKQGAITLTTTGTSGAATLVGNTLNIPNYTPDLSGYVTIGTTQTITGTKTFSEATRQESGLLLKNGVLAGATGYASLGGASNGLVVQLSGSANQQTLIFQSGAAYSYTLPATSGTLALTSQIPANPVTGTGTTNTLPKFTAASTIGNSNITDSGSLISLGSNSYVNGNVGIGSTPSTNIGLLVSRNITGGVTSYGTFSNGTIQSDVTTTATFNATFIGTAAASFTVNNAYGNYVAGTTIGAGSAISTQQAYYVHSNFTSATANYGFRGAIPSGTNRWNLFMDGTAANYMAGTLSIGTTSTSYALTVQGAIYANNDGSSVGLYINSNGAVRGLGTFYIDTASGSNADLIFRPNIAEALRMKPNGNILIGTTTDSGFKLDVNGTARVSGQLTANSFVPTSSTIPTNGMYLSGTNTLGFATNSTLDMVLDATGNLGLGVTPASNWGRVGFEIGVAGASITREVRDLVLLSNSIWTSTGLIYAAGAGAGRFDVGVSSFRWYTAPTGTAGNAISFTQAMTLDNNGALGIGSTSLTGYSLRVSKNITGATVGYGVASDGQVQTDVTSTARYFQSVSNLAASVSVGGVNHFRASQGTFGSGAAITNAQVGFFADAGLIGAVNNYGFQGSIAAGTNRWNIYMDGTAANYLAGSLGIGSTSLTGKSLAVSKVITGQYISSGGSYGVGILSDGQIQSDEVGGAAYFRAVTSTQAATFTSGSVAGFAIEQGTFGAGSIVSNQYGFVVGSTLIGGTNNYAFFSDIASGTNRWNLYMAGTAANYMAGKLLIGTTTDAGFKLDTYGGQSRFNDSSYNRYTLRVQSNAANNANGWGGIAFSGESSNTKAGIFFQSIGSSFSRGNLVFAINNAADQTDATPSNAVLTLANTGTATFSGLVVSYNTFNTQTASYTLVLADASKIVETNVASANTVTVPTNASVAFPIGTEITVMQYGAGVTTIASSGGVTINSKSNARIIANRYTGATLVKRGTDEWYLIGNIVP